jgi:hypothetical protein
MRNEEIDHIIDGICQEFDSLSDAFDFPDEPQPEEQPAERNEFPEGDDSYFPPDSGIGGTFRPAGNIGGFVNMFPANAYGACRPDFLLVLPSDPLRRHRKVTPHERERRTIHYFQNALRALHNWASNCRGKDVYLLTEQWPVAPGITRSPLWSSALAPEWEASSALKRLRSYASSLPHSHDIWDIIHDLEMHRRRHWPRHWFNYRNHLADRVRNASLPNAVRGALMRSLAPDSFVFIDPALTFHENLQAFREVHPDVNFHIRLTTMPREKPVRFECLSGKRWPLI